MVSKIRAHIANAKSTFTGLQVLGMLIWWLVKNINLSRKHTTVHKLKNQNQMLNRGIKTPNTWVCRTSLIPHSSKWSVGTSCFKPALYVLHWSRVSHPQTVIRCIMYLHSAKDRHNYSKLTLLLYYQFIFQVFHSWLLNILIPYHYDQEVLKLQTTLVTRTVFLSSTTACFLFLCSPPSPDISRYYQPIKTSQFES